MNESGPEQQIEGLKTVVLESLATAHARGEDIMQLSMFTLLAAGDAHFIDQVVGLLEQLKWGAGKPESAVYRLQLEVLLNDRINLMWRRLSEDGYRDKHDPVLAYAKKKYEKAEADRTRIDRIKEGVRNGLKKLKPYVIPAVLLTVGWPFIQRVGGQVVYHQVQAAYWGGRDAASHPEAGASLNGAYIHFACESVEVEEDGVRKYKWRPIDVMSKWSTDRLKQAPFNVAFDEGGDHRAVDVAEAGWGTTINFTNGQIEHGMPSILDAQNVGNGHYYVPTAHFREDWNEVVDSVFTTGATAADGLPLQYYLLKPEGGLACEGDAPGPQIKKGVEAILTTGLPSLVIGQLTDKLHEVGTVDKTWFERFDAFGLGNWYKRIMPNTGKFLGMTVRDASAKGVDHMETKKIVDFFAERQFEQQLYRLLQVLENKIDQESFEGLVAFAAESNAPFFDQAAQNILDEVGASGITIIGSGLGSRILLESESLSEKTITHELMHAFFQGSYVRHIPNMGLAGMVYHGSFSDNQVEKMRGSLLSGIVTEGVTELFTQIAVGNVADFKKPLESGPSYHGRTELARHLIFESNVSKETLDYYMQNIGEDFTDEERDILTRMNISLPSDIEDIALFKLMLKAAKLNMWSSYTEREHAKPIFLALHKFKTLKENSDDATTPELEALALEIVGILKAV